MDDSSSCNPQLPLIIGYLWCCDALFTLLVVNQFKRMWTWGASVLCKCKYMYFFLSIKERPEISCSFIRIWFKAKKRHHFNISAHSCANRRSSGMINGPKNTEAWRDFFCHWCVRWASLMIIDETPSLDVVCSWPVDQTFHSNCRDKTKGAKATICLSVGLHIQHFYLWLLSST